MLLQFRKSNQPSKTTVPDPKTKYLNMLYEILTTKIFFPELLFDTGSWKHFHILKNETQKQQIIFSLFVQRGGAFLGFNKTIKK